MVADRKVSVLSFLGWCRVVPASRHGIASEPDVSPSTLLLAAAQGAVLAGVRQRRFGTVRWMAENKGVMMQRERVQDQYPWTWEIPMAVVCGVLVVGVAICQLGRALANWFAGGGWLWPPPDNFVTSIPALLAGDAAAGLSGVQNAASAAALWGWLSVVGLLTVTASTLACVWVGRRWGPGPMRGMATVAEAHGLLGEDRLWNVRHVVRPDLYPARKG